MFEKENSVLLTIEPFDYFDIIKNFRDNNEIWPEDEKYFSEEMRNEMYAKGYMDANDMETCEAQSFWLSRHQEYCYPGYEDCNVYASTYISQYRFEKNISTSYKDHFFLIILTRNDFEICDQEPPPELLEHEHVLFQNRCYDPELVIEIVVDIQTINLIDFSRFTRVQRLNIVTAQKKKLIDEKNEHYRKYIPEAITSVRELYISNSLCGKISLSSFPNLESLEYCWNIKNYDEIVIRDNGKRYQKRIVRFERELELEFIDVPSSLIKVKVDNPCLNNYQVFDAVEYVDVPRVHGWDMPPYEVLPDDFHPIELSDEDTDSD